MKSVLSSGKSVDKAAWREEFGWVRFDLGDAGNPSDDYKGGHGLAHIRAKHPKDLDKLPEVLAKGDVYRNGEKFYVVHSDRFAVLAPLAKGHKRTITSFEPLTKGYIEEIKKYPRAKRPGAE